MQSGVIHDNSKNNSIDHDFANEEREVPSDILKNQFEDFE
jgi:hypothetical protein